MMNLFDIRKLNIKMDVVFLLGHEFNIYTILCFFPRGSLFRSQNDFPKHKFVTEFKWNEISFIDISN